MRAHARAGQFLAEVVFSLGLATVLLSVLAAELSRQRLELGTARSEARAQAALESAAERLRAGLVAPPAPGQVVRVEPAPAGLTLDLRRDERALDPRLPGVSGLVPLRLGVVWRPVSGREERRELFLLARAGGSP